MVLRNRNSIKDNSNSRSDNVDDDNDNSIVSGALIFIFTLMVLGNINYLPHYQFFIIIIIIISIE